MKKSGSFLNCKICARGGAVAIALAALSAIRVQAAVEIFTNQTDFFNALSGPAYFESFSKYNAQAISGGFQAFSFGGDSFTLNDDDSYGILYSSTTGLFAQASVFAGTGSPGDNFVITFPSDNITAFGGTFFLADGDYDPIAGADVTVTLSTGQSINLASTADYETEPFAGFTSSIPIDSITIAGPTEIGDDGEFAYLSLDNFYLGQSDVVPEPTTWALLLASLGLMIGIGRWRARSAASKRTPFSPCP